MALTRNLYREDEVIAALIHSVVNGKVAEALFWTQEAIESDMDVRIFQALLSVWLHCVGVQNVPWLGCLVESLRSSMDEEVIISLVVELTQSPKDSSVFALQGLGLKQTVETPDHVGSFKLPEGLQGLSTLETTFAKAVLQGKSEFAWFLSMELWSSGRADMILWEIQPLAAFGEIPVVLESIWSDDFVWPFRALAILMAASKRDFIGIVLPPAPTEHVEAWNIRKNLRMRERRQFPIPPECLHCFTERGNLPESESTENDLIGDIRPLLMKSPFWEDKTEPDIFDVFMTSDIPDEWSSAARRISHGPGVHTKGPERYTPFGVASIPSKLIWRGQERATDILLGRWKNATHFSSFENYIKAAYNELTSQPLPYEKWDLTPRRLAIEI